AQALCSLWRRRPASSTLFPYATLFRSRDAESNRRARAILNSAIEMGRQLGLPCVAEGVENREELLLLESLGCHSAQGYLLARPMPAEQLFSWHLERKACRALSAWLGE